MSKERIKIEIKTKEIPVSSKEIESFMDFDSILDEYKNTKKKRNGWWILSIVIGMFMLGSGAYFFPDNSKEESLAVSQKHNVEKAMPTVDKIVVVQKDSIKNLNNKALHQKIELKTEKKKPKESNSNLSEAKNTNRNKETTEPKMKEATEGTAYNYVEAVPVDGLENLYAYFEEALIYPEELKKDSVEGTVLVSFAILKDSTVGNIKILQSLGDKFDKEAIRIIENMPKWIPATVNNTAVGSKLSIPLNFSIDH